MELNKLEQYYLGDESWNNFYKLYKDIPNTSHYSELKTIFNDITLIKVIEGKIGATSLDWIVIKIPALDDLSPIDCVNDPILIKRLKTMLMRM